MAIMQRSISWAEFFKFTGRADLIGFYDQTLEACATYFVDENMDGAVLSFRLPKATDDLKLQDLTFTAEDNPTVVVTAEGFTLRSTRQYPAGVQGFLTTLPEVHTFLPMFSKSPLELLAEEELEIPVPSGVRRKLTWGEFLDVICRAEGLKLGQELVVSRQIQENAVAIQTWQVSNGTKSYSIQRTEDILCVNESLIQVEVRQLGHADSQATGIQVLSAGNIHEILNKK
jgi:hypothetical protein